MKRWILRIALALAVVLVALVATAWWLVRGSVARLDGQVALPGLSAAATIRRDALGVVTIDAASQADAMRALGYVHAQERFFEMDLMRRDAAGELSALLGPIALDVDRKHRVHRLRVRAGESLGAALQAGAAADVPGGDATSDAALAPGDQAARDPGKQAVLDAYVAGVNAGLRDLRVRPWPYLLLRQQPKPWTPVDSVLTGDAMYFDLQDSTGERELALWRMRPHLPAALFALLVRDGTRWDAPLQGAPRGDAALLGAAAVDLRKLPMPARPRAFVSKDEPFKGSNNFAVDGSLTADGRAILADDMHLGLRVPDIWFRVRLRYPDPRAPGGRVDANGFSLPGLPALVVGSNGHIAWGFTNAYADTSDWLRTPKPDDDDAPQFSGVYKYDERIEVAGRATESLEVRETLWGPVLHTDRQGNLYSLRWTAQQPGALNFGLLDFLRASDRDDALRIADSVGIPVQNLLVADSRGEIGWRLLGALPAHGEDACPASMGVADTTEAPGPGERAEPGGGGACAMWTVDSALPPHIEAIGQPRLWSANNRTLDGAALADEGALGGYDLGARARQIRDDLLAKGRFAEKDLYAIQLDDRTLFMRHWWELLQAQARRGKTPAMRALAEASKTWTPRATPDAVAYRIARAWRQAVVARIADGLTAPAQAALGDDFIMPRLPQLEGVAWPMATQQPANLLPRRYASWPALFEDAARDVRDGLSARGPLAARNWGEYNTAAICHPLAPAIPLIGKRLLCMPPDRLPGDSNMPRVAAPDFGASERMVVSPGHEADGIIQMPGGQSGNPLSPFWGAGHADWVRGRPTPFLPGKARYTLTLRP